MTDLTDLAQFRGDASPKKKVEWTIEVVQPIFAGRILALDQSIANTGWAVIEQGGRVSAQGNLKTEPTTTAKSRSHEDLLQRASILFNEFVLLMQEVAPDLVVHEMPPAGGRMRGGGESSLVTANAVRNAATALAIPVRMESAQRAKKRWTGNGNAEKKMVKEALLRLEPSLADRKPMNEAIYDAIAVGWLASEEQP